jgi:dihydropteroate synthase
VPAALWRCGAFTFPAGAPVVMGILNVTPDSFSDGGSYPRRESAIAAGLAMIAAGAGIVDVGGESTRPGAEPVPVTEEADRVVAVVRALAERGACVSVDTRHAEVAAAAVAAGAAVVNDVTGFSDPEMVRVAAESNAGLVVMHMRGEPRTMQADPVYADVVGEVACYLAQQADTLRRVGIDTECIALDPGIGFGKTTAHNLALLGRLGELVALGYPVLVGASRKRFIGEITGVAEPRERVAGSVAAALAAVERGALIVRVHDVPETVQALAVEAAIQDGGRAWRTS